MSDTSNKQRSILQNEGDIEIGFLYHLLKTPGLRYRCDDELFNAQYYTAHLSKAIFEVVGHDLKNKKILTDRYDCLKSREPKDKRDRERLNVLIEQGDDFLGEQDLGFDAYHRKFCRIVEKRRLIQVAKDLAETLNKENVLDSEKLSNQAMTSIQSLQKKATDGEFYEQVQEIDFIEGYNEWHAGADKAKLNQGIAGLKTGFSILDRILNGFQKGQFIVIAASPSQGKSALMCNMAHYITLLNDEASVYILSLEMLANMTFNRLMATETDIPCNILRSGLRDVHDDLTRAKYNEAITLALERGKLQQHTYIIDKRQKLRGIKQITNAIRQAKAKHPKIEAVFLDHMQLDEVVNMPPSGNRYVSVSEVSAKLKEVASELNIAVIGLSQLNRSSSKEVRPPHMSDLRDSGNIEQDADIIMLLHTEFKGQDERLVQLIVAKNRDGETAKIDLVFDGATMKFREATKAEADDLRLRAKKREGERSYNLDDFLENPPISFPNLDEPAMINI